MFVIADYRLGFTGHGRTYFFDTCSRMVVIEMFLILVNVYFMILCMVMLLEWTDANSRLFVLDEKCGFWKLADPPMCCRYSQISGLLQKITTLKREVQMLELEKDKLKHCRNAFWVISFLVYVVAVGSYVVLRLMFVLRCCCSLYGWYIIDFVGDFGL